MKTSPFDRSRRSYRALLTRHRRDCEKQQLPCWLCPPGQNAIDYSLQYPHPESFSSDHALPVDEHPELAEDPLNLRPAHLICNQRRGTDDPHIDIGQPSEDW